MQSTATTVAKYLAELPPDRRAAISAVRDVILKNLDRDYEEGMQYGMIGYYIPHRVYPAGYHCDPKQPLPFAGLASQKSHMSLYLMGLYIGIVDGKPGNEHTAWFQDAWKKTGKKLDMGKACVRFKKLDDVPLAVVGESIRRIPAKSYIKNYEAVLSTMKSKKPAATKTTTATKKSAATKKPAAAKKPAAKKPAAKKSAARA
jgi:hypothetical protein